MVTNDFAAKLRASLEEDAEDKVVKAATAAVQKDDHDDSQIVRDMLHAGADIDREMHEVTKATEGLESILEKIHQYAPQGLTASESRWVNVAVEAYMGDYLPAGTRLVPAAEAFGGTQTRLEATAALEASIGEALHKAADYIKSLFVRMGNWVKGLWNRLFGKGDGDKAAQAQKVADAATKAADAAEGKTAAPTPADQKPAKESLGLEEAATDTKPAARTVLTVNGKPASDLGAYASALSANVDATLSVVNNFPRYFDALNNAMKHFTSQDGQQPGASDDFTGGVMETFQKEAGKASEDFLRNNHFVKNGEKDYRFDVAQVGTISLVAHVSFRDRAATGFTLAAEAVRSQGEGSISAQGTQKAQTLRTLANVATKIAGASRMFNAILTGVEQAQKNADQTFSGLERFSQPNSKVGQAVVHTYRDLLSSTYGLSTYVSHLILDLNNAIREIKKL